MASPKARVLLVGCGGVGTMAALNLERGNLAEVSCVLRSNYELVRERGFTIRSCEHGDLGEWRPTGESQRLLSQLEAYILLADQ
jgi:ketopantoate reductase